MIPEEALNILERTQRVPRLRYLTSDQNPDKRSREAYRAMVIRHATGEGDISARSRPVQRPDEAVRNQRAQKRIAGMDWRVRERMANGAMPNAAPPVRGRPCCDDPMADIYNQG